MWLLVVTTYNFMVSCTGRRWWWYPLPSSWFPAAIEFDLDYWSSPGKSKRSLAFHGSCSSSGWCFYSCFPRINEPVTFVVLSCLVHYTWYVSSWYFLQIVCASRDFQLGDINKINIRLYNHTKTIALKNLKAAYISKCHSAFYHRVLKFVHI